MNTMKLLNKLLAGSIGVVLLLSANKGFSQGAEKASLSITLSYFEVNNQLPHISAMVKTKVDGRFKPAAGIPLKLFLNKDSSGTVIGNIITDENGQGFAFIPPSLKSEWKSSKTHTFLATFYGNKKYESAKADLTVAKAKIEISTSDKTITAKVFQLNDTTWVPVKGVDVKFGVKRLGADLPVNETPTFTTDSTGQAAADFKRDSIPGDSKGNIVLVAKVEDNDQFGNIAVEKTVPWGAKFVPLSNFNERTLYATRDKAPIWLLIISGGIIIAVWLTLILLVQNIFRIKKLGQETD